MVAALNCTGSYFPPRDPPLRTTDPTRRLAPVYALFCLLGLSFTLAAAPAPRPPNVVVILGDDIGCESFGFPAPVRDYLHEVGRGGSALFWFFVSAGGIVLAFSDLRIQWAAAGCGCAGPEHGPVDTSSMRMTRPSCGSGIRGGTGPNEASSGRVSRDSHAIGPPRASALVSCSSPLTVGAVNPHR
jgi:hypothetical protein